MFKTKLFFLFLLLISSISQADEPTFYYCKPPESENVESLLIRIEKSDVRALNILENRTYNVNQDHLSKLVYSLSEMDQSSPDSEFFKWVEDKINERVTRYCMKMAIPAEVLYELSKKAILSNKLGTNTTETMKAFCKSEGGVVGASLGFAGFACVGCLVGEYYFGDMVRSAGVLQNTVESILYQAVVLSYGSVGGVLGSALGYYYSWKPWDFDIQIATYSVPKHVSLVSFEENFGKTYRALYWNGKELNQFKAFVRSMLEVIKESKDIEAIEGLDNTLYFRLSPAFLDSAFFKDCS